MLIYALVGATFIVTMLEMLVYRWLGLRSLNYTARFDVERVTAGERIHFVEVVSNSSFIPLPWLRVESAFDLSLRFHGQSEKRIRLGSQFHQFHYSVFTLPARTKITRQHDVICERRGVYTLTSAAMTTGDLFGLYRGTKQIPLTGQLMVYPQMLALTELPVPVHRLLGDMLVRQFTVADPFSVSGVREYVPGDEIRLINWKATAHANQTMVHRRDFTADSQLLIYLNVEDSPNMWNKVSRPDLIEHGIVYAASVARYAIETGGKVGFVTNGSGDGVKQIAPLSGIAHLEILLESMARLQIERNVDFVWVLQEAISQQLQYRDILLLTTYVDDGIQNAIDDLERLNNVVRVVNLAEVVPEIGDLPKAVAK